jgi:uncharacterized membrane protein HdeD (DUF308 family)
MSTSESATAVRQGETARVFLTRGLVAILWAAVFAAASMDVTDDVPIGVGILLVVYPLIDAVASLSDARNEHGGARRVLLGNAAFSAVAAVALGVAATGSVADVLVVFGIWAGVSGAAQLVTALRRRAIFGNQWPMLLAGSFSVVAGVAYVLAATAGDPQLNGLVLYTATGGVEFVVQAWLLTRRRRRLAAAVPA